MHIEYETTLDEIADAHLRIATRSKLAKRTRWQATFWGALYTGIILFMCLTLLGAALPERFIVVGIGITVGAGGYWMNYRRSMKRRMMEYLRERMPSDCPLHFVAELREDCIWTKQGGTQLSFDWTNVAEIADAGDAIEFRMRDGGFVIVRNKGFATEENRREFMEFANQRLNGTARKFAVL